MEDDNLRCGSHAPMGEVDHHALIRAGQSPCQAHNNCSGKHAGFLTLTQHLGAGPDYIEIDHPVQRACLDAFEEVTGAPSPGYGIDGCSAPNFQCKLKDMARAMAFFASAQDGMDPRQSAAVQLWQAMIKHPELVAGEGRACTELMRACTEPVALKTGAEGYFIAILPTRKLGVALKITDGATRASECAIAAILIRLGVLDAAHPAAQNVMNKRLTSWRGFDAGVIRPAAALA
jgi:L-asparaginase II